MNVSNCLRCGSYNTLRIRESLLTLQRHVDQLTSALRFDMTREQMNELSQRKFEGPIHVVNSQEEEYRLFSSPNIKKLTKEGVVGFDTETAISWDSKTHIPAVSLIQIASEDVAVLWRLRRNDSFLYSDFPKVLKNILTNQKILKVGTGLSQDMQDLLLQYDVNTTGSVDNQALANKLGVYRNGLGSLAAQLYGWKISKSKQRANWEQSQLTAGHVAYAATDAWMSLLIYKKLKRLMDTLNLDMPTPGVASNLVVIRERKADQSMFKALDSQILSMLPKHVNVPNANERRLQSKRARSIMTHEECDFAHIADVFDLYSKAESINRRLDLFVTQILHEKPYLYTAATT